MGVLDLFSKRRKKERGEVPDVYQYDDIPRTLRVQISLIIKELLGGDLTNSAVGRAYRVIVEALRREYGVLALPPTDPRFAHHYGEELVNFLFNARTAEEVMDVVELTFRVAENAATRIDYIHGSRGAKVVADGVDELNERFKEHGVGYQFIDQEVIRIDSQLIHAEVVKPALMLLNTKHYRGPHQEFLAAYEHYRHGRKKEALNECLKAFESTMKAICDKRKWTYQPNDTASKLVQICLDNGLVPAFWQTQLTSLRSLLESSIPTGRNKLSGHGQGATPTDVPDHIAAFMLHMTASTLVFLTKAESELP